MAGAFPARTPPPVIDVLFNAVVRAYDDPALRADSTAAGAVVALSSSPAEFTHFMEVETMKLGKIVKAANLTTLN